MSLSGRVLPAAAAIVFVLALFGVYTSIYPIADSNTQSTAQVIIPVLEPGDEEPTVEKSGDDTPTPALLAAPTQYSEAMETAPDPWTSERMEVASKEPSVEELKKLDGAAKGDQVLRGSFSNPASRPADPVLPKSETPYWGNTTTSYQDPAQPLTDPYTEVTPQPASPPAPPDASTATQASPQPPLDPPADTQTSPQPPPDLPADTQTSPQPPIPQDGTTSSHLPAGPSPPTEDATNLE